MYSIFHDLALVITIVLVWKKKVSNTWIKILIGLYSLGIIGDIVVLLTGKKILPFLFGI